MKLTFADLAKADIDNITAWVSVDDPGAAWELKQEIIFVCTEYLTKTPMMGRMGSEGTREWVVRKNYIIVYEIRDQEIEILHVRHAAQYWTID